MRTYLAALAIPAVILAGFGVKKGSAPAGGDTGTYTAYERLPFGQLIDVVAITMQSQSARDEASGAGNLPSFSATTTVCTHTQWIAPHNWSSGLTIELGILVNVAGGAGLQIALSTQITEFGVSSSVYGPTVSDSGVDLYDIDATINNADIWRQQIVIADGINIAVGDIFNIEICRVGGDASDDWTGLGRVMFISAVYTANKGF
jgi:hypothetical protein